VPPVSGWYPDPTGRFEYRYHNDDRWTGDVATNGQRFVDPLPTPASGHGARGADPGAGGPAVHGNGIAVASMVCGIVALVIAWIPFLGVAGLIAAVVGLALSVPAMRRSRPSGTRRGIAITGLVTSSIGIALGVVGIVLSVYLVRAIDRFDDPGPHEAVVTSCREDGRRVLAEGRVTNRSDSTRDYSVHVELGFADDEWVTVEDVPAGGTGEFTARAVGSLTSDGCEVVAVRGPAPFGLDPSVFEP
jgi:hypothetical protein